MRPDFYRVVTERPRRGSRNRNRKTHFRVHGFDASVEGTVDSLPRSEKMVRYFRGPRADSYKEFSDVTGPIKRFLLHRRGHKWDDVYSEIRRALPANSPEPVRHVYENHIKWQIEMHCRLDANGEVRDTRWGHNVVGFYIHPVTRTLEYKEPVSYKARYRKNRDRQKTIGNGLKWLRPEPLWSEVIEDPDVGYGWHEATFTVAKPDDTTRVVKLNGIWYVWTYRERTQHEREREYDDDYGRRQVEYLPRLVRVDSKQANKRELKRYGLRNDPPKPVPAPRAKFAN